MSQFIERKWGNLLIGFGKLSMAIESISISAAIREALVALGDAKEKRSSDDVAKYVATKHPDLKKKTEDKNFGVYVSQTRGKMGGEGKSASRGKSDRGVKSAQTRAATSKSTATGRSSPVQSDLELENAALRFALSVGGIEAAKTALGKLS